VVAAVVVVVADCSLEVNSHSAQLVGWFRVQTKLGLCRLSGGRSKLPQFALWRIPDDEGYASLGITRNSTSTGVPLFTHGIKYPISTYDTV